jgi:hypothetical protein
MPATPRRNGSAEPRRRVRSPAAAPAPSPVISAGNRYRLVSVTPAPKPTPSTTGSAWTSCGTRNPVEYIPKPMAAPAAFTGHTDRRARSRTSISGMGWCISHPAQSASAATPLPINAVRPPGTCTCPEMPSSTSTSPATSSPAPTRSSGSRRPRGVVATKRSAHAAAPTPIAAPKPNVACHVTWSTSRPLSTSPTVPRARSCPRSRLRRPARGPAARCPAPARRPGGTRRRPRPGGHGRR